MAGLRAWMMVGTLAVCLGAAGGCGSEASDGGTGGPDTGGGPGLPDGGSGGPDLAGGGDTKPAADVRDTGGPARPDVENGDFGEPCLDNTSCESGYCVEGPAGFICTRVCLTECPEGFGCRAVAETWPDTVFLCIPNFSRTCQPCTEDVQCPGARCVQLEGAGYCLSTCGDAAGECPASFRCEATALPDGETADLCLPETGSCACRPATVGQQRSCHLSNEFGSCEGLETCQADGSWTGCTARTAEEEVCDGRDNDCDGALDEDLPETQPCERTNQLGTCAGVASCAGSFGWLCGAPEPEAERCDRLDNDCDGATDEDFLTDGRYTDLEHCGRCEVSCLLGFPHATGTACDASGETPQCVVTGCEPGYVALDPFQCIPNVGTLCQPCEDDAGCRREGAVCAALNDGTFCLEGCATAGDCPPGYGCQEVAEAPGALHCVPESGTCSCDGSNPDLRRGCTVEYDPPGEGAPSYECEGVQACTAEGWGPCELAADVCDGLDNDCDGFTDDGALDPVTGRYVTAEHCGACDVSCLALCDVPTKHCAGVCDAGGPVPLCAVGCDDGWFDVNDNYGDGCECAYAGAVDHPDGVDQDCDGVDGEIGNALFVAKDGDDTNDGSIDAPLLTIGEAVRRARGAGKRDVYVATGVYPESVKLRAGVAVYGGFSSTFRARDRILYETVIFGQAPTADAPGAVTAVGVSGEAAAVLDGFSVYGADVDAASGSSYAVYVRDCDAALRLANNRIYAGDGGDGPRGANGSGGGDGNDGVDGVDARDNGACAQNTRVTDGGRGGDRTCGTQRVAGGDGGDAFCPDYDEVGLLAPVSLDGIAEQFPDATQRGAAGSGPGAGAGGTTGWDLLIDGDYSCGTCQIPPEPNGWNGLPGTPGADGADGAAGGGCTTTAGTVQDALWRPVGGGAGGDGGAGGGGGGGGAGGGVEVYACSSLDGTGLGHDVGGSGGGGGSGGCGGTAGAGGGGGGGSFGVFLAFTVVPVTVPVMEGNTVTTGYGGTGGDGGIGGTGGANGTGGDGGLGGGGVGTMFCAPAGGPGGAGGQGGHGGGGGGGCGGPSYAFYVAGQGGADLSGVLSANTVLPVGAGGQGGRGGESLGEAGDEGADGASAAANF